eukprot:1157603-Pelagomonas_calceolata.AAC.3
MGLRASVGAWQVMRNGQFHCKSAYTAAAASVPPIHLQSRSRGMTSSRTPKTNLACVRTTASVVLSVAYDDPLGMLNPTLYCTRCFLMLHPSGQALPPATVFPYIRYDDGGVEEEPGMEGVGQ